MGPAATGQEVVLRIKKNLNLLVMFRDEFIPEHWVQVYISAAQGLNSQSERSILFIPF